MEGDAQPRKGDTWREKGMRDTFNEARGPQEGGELREPQSRE
jgi:hypothetical protein